MKSFLAVIRPFCLEFDSCFVPFTRGLRPICSGVLSRSLLLSQLGGPLQAYPNDANNEYQGNDDHQTLFILVGFIILHRLPP